MPFLRSFYLLLVPNTCTLYLQSLCTLPENHLLFSNLTLPNTLCLFFYNLYLANTFSLQSLTYITAKT